MSIEEALKLLKEYGCIKLKIAQSSEEEEALRQAILLVNQGSESINLGICADNNEEDKLPISIPIREPIAVSWFLVNQKMIN